MITISKHSIYEYFAANFGGYRILLCFSKQHLIIGLILFTALTKTVKKTMMSDIHLTSTTKINRKKGYLIMK